MLTTVDKLIIDARLQAAAEQAWREATDMHNAALWKPGRWHALPLRMMHPSVTAFNPDQQPTIEPIPNPIAYGQAELLTTGVRVVFTAPHYGTDWSWVACRFSWRGDAEHNYTR